MTAEILLKLIQSWKEMDCPGEILLDAMMDYGIDVEKGVAGKGGTFRGHIAGPNACSSRNERNVCYAVHLLQKQLIQEVMPF